MIQRRFGVLALFCAGLSLVACGGGSDDDDDDDDDNGRAGAGMTGAGSGGNGAAAGSGGTGNGGTAGSVGKAGGGGSSGTLGSGGTAGLAGSAGSGSAGQPTVLPPLSATDDPSRISELSSCALAQAGTCVVPITRTKEEVCQRFAQDWPKQAPADYTLPDEMCSPAVIGAGAAQDAMRRLNFYRWLTDLPATALNAEWSTHAAACSIIQSHLDGISHYPPPESTCYTEVGGVASAESLLDKGAHAPADAMDDLIWDWGQRNFHVLGHRWWLLHPGLTQVGLGFAFPEGIDRAYCVRDTDGVSPLDRPRDLTGVVPYPSYGITPHELISREAHARPVENPLEWSLTFDDSIDATTATVKVFRAGASSYEPVTATAGPIADFPGMWINLAMEPVPAGTYLILVSGTSIGDFGYRARIERCGADTPLTCDVLEQDCGVAGYGCYNPDAPYCGKSGNLAAGTACKGNLQAECAPGSTCVEDYNARDAFECAAFCDPENTASPKYCPELCTGTYVLVDNLENEIVGAYCLPNSGDACDPLAPECPVNQGCYGWDPPHCLKAGSIAKDQPCTYSNDCAPGLACIGTGAADSTCQAYCDLTATDATGCETLCGFDFWAFDDFGVCRAEEP